MQEILKPLLILLSVFLSSIVASDSGIALLAVIGFLTGFLSSVVLGVLSAGLILLYIANKFDKRLALSSLTWYTAIFCGAFLGFFIFLLCFAD